MTELILHYIVPNVLMFGTLYAVGLAIEKTVWYTILAYCECENI
jgi:hypothetical protein